MCIKKRTIQTSVAGQPVGHMYDLLDIQTHIFTPTKTGSKYSYSHAYVCGTNATQHRLRSSFLS